MSKMSQLHMELSESASDLGFASIEEAEQAGYVADYNTGTMYKPCPLNELAKAHEAWEGEKEEVLKELKELHDHLMELGYDTLAESVFKAISFIEKGEI